MLVSMTGFGSSTQSFRTSRGLLEITAELKTVNSKFLDVSIRSPRPYIPFDPEVAKLVRAKLKRGRVDVAISMRVLEGTAKQIAVNLPAAKALAEAFQKVNQALHLNENIRLADLLELPEWIETREADFDREEEWKVVKKTVELAVQQVIDSRSREGKALQAAIDEHQSRFEEIFEKISAEHPQLLEDLRGRVRERIQALYGNEGFDPQRLEQEIVLWVTRSDFQEEIDRIRHHLQTLRSIIQSQGEVGRKLEFLVQELHREVNTLGSKCPDAATTPLIIELKTCIERIREQIQNIE